MKKIQREDVARWIPTRDKKTYKNKLGHVLCIGGNENMGGAILLSAAAALYSGAGLVTVATHSVNQSALHARAPETMFIDYSEMDALMNTLKKVDVIIIGPGMGLDNQAKHLFNAIVQQITNEQWLIIDGDALTHFAQSEESFSHINTVLTPHLGEWKRLTGIKVPAADTLANAKWCERLDSVVVLKKERTEVYFKQAIWQNTAGNPSMATGGMGDTLTGIIGSFISQFENKNQAILSAVYIHSAAADKLAQTHYVTLPTKIIDYLPYFIKNLKIEESS